MHPNTTRAINRLASKHGLKITRLEDDCVAVADMAGVRILRTIEVHRVRGGWISAHWSERNSRWQSSDVRNAEQSFGYAFARTLPGLADYGVTTYRNPAEAIRANLMS